MEGGSGWGGRRVWLGCWESLAGVSGWAGWKEGQSGRGGRRIQLGRIRMCSVHVPDVIHLVTMVLHGCMHIGGVVMYQ